MRHSYNYDDWAQQESVKVEPPSEKELPFKQHSPPHIPFSSQSVNGSSVLRSSSQPRRSASPVVISPGRHTNPNLSSTGPTLSTEFSSMSHSYRQYSATPPSAGSDRRSGSGDPAAAFSYPDSYAQGTSSLSGAMGLMTTSPSGMAWAPQPSSLPEGYNMDSDSFNTFFANPPTPLSAQSASFVSYGSYTNASGYPSSSNVQTPMGSGYSEMAYPASAGTIVPRISIPSQPSSSNPVPMVVSPPPGGSRAARRTNPEEEIRRLRERVQRLMMENRELQNRLQMNARQMSSQASTSASGLPSPAPTPTFSRSSQAFQQSWNLRTEARRKLFCSLNRAGNALCAWHDSRRERRQYPPRNAPDGYLNCGCTYEEALFEESLARHGVGSYHPGENVRMDPALRNPLLKLLKERYGYQDGDFERDPITGGWVEGEGPGKWQAKFAAGGVSKKSRGGEDRY